MLVESLTEELLQKCWSLIYNSKTDDIRRISKGSDGVSLKEFQKNEVENIKNLYKDIHSGRFVFDSLLPIPRVKSDGKSYRILTVPTVRDRILHKAILSIIVPHVFPYINTKVSYCGVKKNYFKKEKENLNVKKAFQQIVKSVKKRKFWVFESDLKAFFDNVDKQKILQKVSKCLPDDSLNDYLRQIVYFKVSDNKEITRKGLSYNPSKTKGVSQGSSLSPLLSNIYLVDFDNYMKSIFGRCFIRYVDDFIILCSSKEEAEKAYKLVSAFLREESIELSENNENPKESKTKIVNLKTGKIDFLGFGISRHKITHKKSLANRRKWMSTIVLDWKKYKKLKKDSNFSSTIEIINSKIEGWAQYYSFVHVDYTFTELDGILDSFRTKVDPIKYDKLVSLKNIKRKPLISEKNWQILFK